MYNSESQEEGALSVPICNLFYYRVSYLCVYVVGSIKMVDSLTNGVSIFFFSSNQIRYCSDFVGLRRNRARLQARNLRVEPVSVSAAASVGEELAFAVGGVIVEPGVKSQ